MNSVGLNSAQPAYNRGESTRAHGAVLHQSPQRFEYLKKNPTHYLTGSLTLYRNIPLVLFLHRPKSTTTNSAGPSSDELVPAGLLDDGCSTSVETKFKT
jgi:hypothetical protein